MSHQARGRLARKWLGQTLGPAVWVPGRGGPRTARVRQEVGQLSCQAAGPRVPAARKASAGVTLRLPPATAAPWYWFC